MNMKQIVLLLGAFLGITLGLRAQSPLQIEPEDYQGAFMVDLSQTVLVQDPTVQITNTTDSTLHLRWQLYNLDMPQGWASQVCDPNECYLPIVRSNIDDELGIAAPVVLEPDSSANISIYILPNEVIGTGRFALDFSLANAPSVVLDMASFTVEITSTVVSTYRSLRQQDIRVYPNPTADYFELTNSAGVDQIVVYNLVGRRVGDFRAYPGRQYDLSHLPGGTYLVTLLNEEIGTIRTLRLIKRTFRP